MIKYLVCDLKYYNNLLDFEYCKEKKKLINNKKWIKIYLKNDLLDRTDGPAYEDFRGYFRWFKEGKLHREDGPAVYWSTIPNFGIYYLNGKEIEVSSDKEFLQYIKLNCFI
jgi:hypothetical protein